MKILARWEKSKDFWFLLLTSLFFFILRFPSLFEPNWYGDEGIYQALGLAMNHGRLLYRDIFDNKPPLLYMTYAFFNSDQFLLRFASLIVGILSVILFFKLSKKLLETPRAVYISTFAFALLFGLPFIEGNIANAENFMLLTNILGGYFILNSIDKPQNKKNKILFSAGILISISFLFKIVGIFDFAALFVFIFFANFSKNLKDIINWNNIKTEIKNLTPYVLGFAIPILITVIYFLINGAFSYFLKATFSNNVGYVGYGNRFIIPQGLLIIKTALLFSAALFLFIKRKTLGLNSVFIYLWLLFSLFNAFFSQRPYTHYVLVVVPSICLLVGLAVLKNKFSRFNILILTTTVILLLISFTYFTKTIFYYQNFLSFITSNKSIISYQSFFDGDTPRDYELASYINMVANKNDNIFVWGNNAQIYALTNKLPPGRYTVAYHITNYKDGLENTQEGLSKENPRFIIVMNNVSKYPFSLAKFINKINIEGVSIYEKLY